MKTSELYRLRAEYYDDLASRSDDPDWKQFYAEMAQDYRQAATWKEVSAMVDDNCNTNNEKGHNDGKN